MPPNKDLMSRGKMSDDADTKPAAPKTSAAALKPSWDHELLLGGAMLLGGSETSVCDRLVDMLGVAADKAVADAKARFARLRPPAPGQPYPDPARFQVQVEALTPQLRVFRLLFDAKSPVVKTLHIDREDAIEAASRDFGPVRAALKEWNEEELMIALEAFVNNAAQKAAKSGNLQLPRTREELNDILDGGGDSWLDMMNRKDDSVRNTRTDSLKPLELYTR